MTRGRRIRRHFVGILWGGTALCVLLYIASAFVGVMHYTGARAGEDFTIFAVSSGAITVGRLGPVPVTDIRSHTDWMHRWDAASKTGTGWHFQWALTRTQMIGGTTVRVPIWIILLPLLTASYMLRSWRRIPDPTKCGNCGYSLAGLRGEQCPECGSTVLATQ